MTIQRKRVAKRLASGLLAGAMALGGLAISGASPVSAETASTTRVYGADRYDTSAQIAAEIFATTPGTALDTVIIASGASYADALAASSLVQVGTRTAPILLTQPDALPLSVKNFLGNTSRVSASATVYVVGGTSVISDAVTAELVTMGFAAANVKRVAGADRYLTAIEVSKKTNVGANSEIIIVSGTNFADGVAVSALAAENEWPVLLAGPNGLSTETQAELKRLIAITGQDEPIHIVGGTSAVSSAVETQIVSASAGGRASQINRIAGSDRYATAAKISALTDGSMTSGVILVTGENFPDALASAAFASEMNMTVVMTKTGSLETSATAAVTAFADANTKPAKIIAIGGEAAVASATLTSAKAVSPSVYDLKFVSSSALAGSIEATSSAVFTFSSAVDVSGDTWTPAMFAVNGSSGALFAGAAVTDAWTAATKTMTITYTRTAPFVAGDVITFLGTAEGSAGASANYSTPAATATAAADTAAPVITITGLDDDGTNSTLSFAVTDASGIATNGDETSAATISITRADGTTAVTCAGTSASTDIASGAFTYQCDGATGATAVKATDIVTITMTDDTPAAGSKATVADVAGNAIAIATPVVLSVPAAAAVTLSGVYSDVHVATASVTLDNAAGDATLTMSGTGAGAGKGGNAWLVRYNPVTGTVLPSVDVDAATKQVVFTFDRAVHKMKDLKWAWDGNADAAALGAMAITTDDLLASNVIAGNAKAFTGGTSSATFTVTASAPLAALAGSSITLTASTGAVGLGTCQEAAVTAGATKVVFTCAAVGTSHSGSVTVAASAIADLFGNSNAATTFTAG